MAEQTLIVGAGVFGLTAAVELAERGHRVTVIDPGPVPHPWAASNDWSKAVRAEYGADRLYTDLADEAIDGWLTWNQQLGRRVYEPTGVLISTRQPMRPGGFEHDSYQLALRRGRSPQRLDGAALTERFPAWGAGIYVDGFYHERGGLTYAGATIEALAEQAKKVGVVLRAGQAAAGLIEDGGRVVGVRTQKDEAFIADHVVLAVGVWTPTLLPDLAGFVKPTAHPLFYLRPPADRVEWFRPPQFCVFTADVSRTGWYGFPADPTTGLVKVALHDAGHGVSPDEVREGVPPHRLDQCRAFLRESLPALAEAEIVEAKHCFYTDTADGHFFIARHRDRAGLTVATGGSGHAMKFAPVLGRLVADAAEGKAFRGERRFAWRTVAGDTPGDAARAQSSDKDQS